MQRNCECSDHFAVKSTVARIVSPAGSLSLRFIIFCFVSSSDLPLASTYLETLKLLAFIFIIFVTKYNFESSNTIRSTFETSTTAYRFFDLQNSLRHRETPVPFLLRAAIHRKSTVPKSNDFFRKFCHTSTTRSTITSH